ARIEPLPVEIGLLEIPRISGYVGGEKERHIGLFEHSAENAATKELKISFEIGIGGGHGQFEERTALQCQFDGRFDEAADDLVLVVGVVGIEKVLALKELFQHGFDLEVTCDEGVGEGCDDVAFYFGRDVAAHE